MIMFILSILRPWHVTCIVCGASKPRSQMRINDRGNHVCKND